MNLRPQHLSLLSFTAGLVVGGVASFLVTKHFVEKKERAIATDEIEQIKNHYRIVRKEGDLADPEKMVFNQTVILPADPENAYGEQSRGADFDENYPKDEEDLQRVANKIASLGYDAATAIIGQTMDEERDLEDHLAARIDPHAAAQREVVGQVMTLADFRDALLRARLEMQDTPGHGVPATACPRRPDRAAAGPGGCPCRRGAA